MNPIGSGFTVLRTVPASAVRSYTAFHLPESACAEPVVALCYWWFPPRALAPCPGPDFPPLPVSPKGRRRSGISDRFVARQYSVAPPSPALFNRSVAAMKHSMNVIISPRSSSTCLLVNALKTASMPAADGTTPASWSGYRNANPPVYGTSPPRCDFVVPCVNLWLRPPSR